MPDREAPTGPDRRPAASWDAAAAAGAGRQAVAGGSVVSRAMSSPLLINLVSLRRSRAGGAETYATELVPRIIERWDGPVEVLVRAESADWLVGLGWPAEVLVPVTPKGSGSMSVVSTALLARRQVRRSGGVVFSPYNIHTAGAARSREVVGVHDLLSFHYVAGEWGPLPLKERLVLEVKARALGDAVSRAGAVVIHSEAVREDVLRFVPSIDPARVHLVPLGADRATLATPVAGEEPTPPKGPCASPPGKPFVLLVGSSTWPHKNLDVAVSMARTETFRRTGARLVIVGRDVPDLSADVAGVVECRRDITDRELAELYATCECLLFPSASEGFGLPLVEAMAGGVACVVSDIAVFRELAGDAAAYFAPYSPDRAAEAVSAVLSDPDRLAGLRTAGRERAARFTWDGCADGYTSVLASLS